MNELGIEDITSIILGAMSQMDRKDLETVLRETTQCLLCAYTVLVLVIGMRSNQLME